MKQCFSIFFSFTVICGVYLPQKQNSVLQTVISCNSGFHKQKNWSLIGKHESTLNYIDRSSDVSFIMTTF